MDLRLELFPGPSETGYTYMLTKLATDGAHAMTIVGYDDTVGFSKDGQIHKGAFIVVNSYGTWWGDDGRYYLPYYFFFAGPPVADPEPRRYGMQLHGALPAGGIPR